MTKEKLSEEEIIKNLREEVKNIKLSPAEKSKIFERVMSSPTISPYTSLRSGWHFTSKTLVYVFASFLILILGGSSITYASMNALPGEKLYAIKIKVAEPVLDTLAFTPEARAERKASKALRRLDEAKKLAEKDALTTNQRVELEARFKESTEDFEKSVLEIKDNGEKRKEKVRINFEKSLETQADVLKKVSDEKRLEREERKKEKERISEISKENDEETAIETEVELLETTVREKYIEKREKREKERKEKNENELEIRNSLIAPN